ncbi:hypothetical protein BDN70DRAFT_769014, partial [Pholiota conissans]
HASARNVVERIFGVLKRRFVILTSPPEYSMAIQACIPLALGAVHNFIREHNPDEILDFTGDTLDPNPNSGSVHGILGTGPAQHSEIVRATSRRDQIAHAMWVSYQ